MKKMNLFVMSLLATAAFTFSSCSNEDTMSPSTSNQEVTDGFYMTLKVKGGAEATTRTVQQGDDNKENGTSEESTISKGVIYIYKGNEFVFKKEISTNDWASAPTQVKEGVTRPIKVSVAKVSPNTEYNVYFLANTNTNIADPLKTDMAFQASVTGGSEYATDNNFAMFNQNDKSRAAAHSTVKFIEANKNVETPASASEIYLDRVVARIDVPTVDVEKTSKITKGESTKTTNYEDLLEGVSFDSYAVSNLNNNSYVVQNWDNKWFLNTLITGNSPYYKPYSAYGTAYEAKGLNNFISPATATKTYLFENSTNNEMDATSLYFCIKANLKKEIKEKADFKDGTFYRYDKKVYVSLEDLIHDTEVANPFGESETGATILKKIQKADGTLIDEAELAKFREKYGIQVYREGKMYYRYVINDNFYTSREGYYSVLRNSIYHLNVNAIYDIGRDVPNGPDTPESVNYYMAVTVSINPWVLNVSDIQLGK